MESENQNRPGATPVFEDEEEIDSKFAYQSGVVSLEEVEQLRARQNVKSLFPEFNGRYTVKEKGRTIIINAPTRIGEKDFPTTITIKEPGFAARALAKLINRPAFIKAEKRRALHGL